MLARGAVGGAGTALGWAPRDEAWSEPAARPGWTGRGQHWGLARRLAPLWGRKLRLRVFWSQPGGSSSPAVPGRPMQLQSHPRGQLPRQPGWPLRRRVGAWRGAGGPGPTLTRSENYGRALLPAGRCRSWERCLPRERDERFPALPTGRGTGWAPRELRGQQPLLRHVAVEPVVVTWHRVRLPGRSLAPERAPGPARTPHPPALPQCPCWEGRAGRVERHRGKGPSNPRGEMARGGGQSPPEEGRTWRRVRQAAAAPAAAREEPRRYI